MRRVLILLALLVAASGASAASAGARPLFGLQGLTSPSDVASAEAAGARLARIGVAWSSLQPTGPGAVDQGTLATLDARIASASARGMRVVLFLSSTPCWASAAPDDVRAGCTSAQPNTGEVTRYRPSDPTAVVPISVLLAARYGGKLAAFQIWNEPDQANEAYWAGPDKVASYVAMVKALYAPLKQANGGMSVLAGSFVGGNGAWLKAMYAAGVKGYYDGLAVQFYARPLEALRTTRAVQTSAGDRKPLWLTEWGFNSCLHRETTGMPTDQPCVSRAAQARGIADVLSATARRSWIKAAVLYELRDQPGGYQLGLFDTRGKPKPALRTLLRTLRRGARARPARPTIRLRVVGDHLRASGSATATELLSLVVRQGGQQRVKYTFAASGSDRWGIDLPAELGTGRGISATVAGAWTGSATARR